jgi:hypothetical protein
MNKNDDDKESVVRISLLDVMYGVVLAYGFNSFDKAQDCSDYFRFFFACAVFVVDWVYVHRLYWGAEYKNILLLLDIGILFSISRLLSTSTAHTPNYFMWLAILFIFYVVWDYVMFKVDKSSSNDFISDVKADGIGCIIFLFIFWKAPSIIAMQYGNVFLNVGTLIVYSIVFLGWFFKKSK